MGGAQVWTLDFFGSPSARTILKAERMKVIAEDLWFPEGPVWLGDGSLLLVEMRRQTLTRVWLDGRKKIVARLGGAPNGAAMGPDGFCYVTNAGETRFIQREDGCWIGGGVGEGYTGGYIQRVNLETGQFQVLYSEVGKNSLKAPNDLVFDGHGGFWFTDFGKTRSRDMDLGSVCYAKVDGLAIREVIFPIHKPNGIGLSPSGEVLYVAETDSGRLWAWELASPGELTCPPKVSTESPHGGRLIYGLQTYARFDSLAVEAGGNICLGTLDRGGVTVCSPDLGLVEFVSVPGDTHLTNLCFGGANFNKAYLTQSYAGRLVEIDWPRQGLPVH
jgi:gluconolactonase